MSLIARLLDFVGVGPGDGVATTRSAHEEDRPAESVAEGLTDGGAGKVNGVKTSASSDGSEAAAGGGAAGKVAA